MEKAESSIKVTIANRVYPLKVKGKEEEETILRSARLINGKLKEYEERFSVRDQQDLIAMFALQYVTESLRKEEEDQTHSRDFSDRLTQLDQLLTDHLRER